MSQQPSTSRKVRLLPDPIPEKRPSKKPTRSDSNTGKSSKTRLDSGRIVKFGSKSGENSKESDQRKERPKSPLESHTSNGTKKPRKTEDRQKSHNRLQSQNTSKNKKQKCPDVVNIDSNSDDDLVEVPVRVCFIFFTNAYNYCYNIPFSRQVFFSEKA